MIFQFILLKDISIYFFRRFFNLSSLLKDISIYFFRRFFNLSSLLKDISIYIIHVRICCNLNVRIFCILWVYFVYLCHESILFIENLHQQREFWIRFVSGYQCLNIPSEIEINPGWRPSSVLLMWSLDIEWENLPIPRNIF